LRDQTQSINHRAIFKLDTGDGEWYKHRHVNFQGVREHADFPLSGSSANTWWSVVCFTGLSAVQWA